MNLLNLLIDAAQLFLILFGFGLVIVIHELGHFVAARWAGVRVLAFAVGFGKPLLSYRKGRGWRRGSTQQEDQARASEPGYGTTEYRLNALPLGGYVKMLGQDDADPSHRSSEPDSYNAAPIWKRMIIISAGVVLNVLSAAALFVVVFLAGLQVPPPIIGTVLPGSAAATAIPQSPNVSEPGLRSGDRILSLDGERTQSFNDIAIAVAMSHPDRGLTALVDRPGVGEIQFELSPTLSRSTGMLQIGVNSQLSGQLAIPDGEQQAQSFQRLLAAAGASELQPGATLQSVNGDSADSAHAIGQAATRSPLSPVELTFLQDGVSTEVVVQPSPLIREDALPSARGSFVAVTHVAGLRPVMAVGDLAEGDRGYQQGLRTGDVFALLGDVEFPSVEEGLTEIRRKQSNTLRAVVLRAGASVDLQLEVDADGRVGFFTASPQQPYLASPPSGVVDGQTFEPRGELPAQLAGITPGSLITRVGETPVSSWNETLGRLAMLARQHEGGEPFSIELELALPLPTPELNTPATKVVTLVLEEDHIQSLSEMRWAVPALEALFEPEIKILRADSPLGAVGLGLHETRRVMLSTYLTFVRLFQGTIQLERLSGPVGIVHIGTVFADRGVIWVLFFFGLVSINLAVINFLPIPITDGGHMIFLIWEQLTGRPVSVLVQNIATLAGLIAIGAMFLYVTFHDILRLLGTGG